MRDTPENATGAGKAGKGRVALFVTCLVDVMRPNVGFAAARLIEAAGFSVAVPAQACCGQPMLNAGDRRGAARAARAMLDAFQGFDFVVVPSGSCAGTVIAHYPALFEPGSPDRRRADDLAGRCRELTQFLVEQGGGVRPPRRSAKVTYHDSCSGLRELGIKQGPRRLLEAVDGVELTEMDGAETCCGFGGVFCVKYPDISGRIAADKCADIAATGAEAVVMGDVGCLLNIEGALHRQGKDIKAWHIAELLAGLIEEP